MINLSPSMGIEAWALAKSPITLQTPIDIARVLKLPIGGVGCGMLFPDHSIIGHGER